METKNAIIESTHLGNEDHGIFSCHLYLKYGGAGCQAFGGYAMDKHNGLRGPESRRNGTAYGCEFIKRVLDTVGTSSWEKLPGKHIRVRADMGKVYAIGHIIDDRWFSPEEDLKAFC